MWHRDQGRCGFVGTDGRRCGETRGLEFAHQKPWGKGGDHSAENLSLRCRAHNALEADRDYGEAFMRGKRKQRGACSKSKEKSFGVKEPRATYASRQPSNGECVCKKSTREWPRGLRSGGLLRPEGATRGRRLFSGIASRLEQFFMRRKPLTIGPQFHGCGLLRSCEGDVLARDTLYEVKAGNRAFRAEDARQLLTYAALNGAANKHQIASLGLINPRLGTCYSATVEELCTRMAGAPATVVLNRVEAFVTSQTLSG